MLASGSSSDIDWVTLAVEPARVEEVVAASRQGNLYFTLPGEAAPKEQTEGAASDAQASKDGGDAK
jgi:pilus assembly protein CpaB